MQKFINIDPMEPGTVFESTGLLQGSDDSLGGTSVVDVEYVAPQPLPVPTPAASSF